MCVSISGSSSVLKLVQVQCTSYVCWKGWLLNSKETLFLKIFHPISLSMLNDHSDTCWNRCLMEWEDWGLSYLRFVTQSIEIRLLQKFVTYKAAGEAVLTPPVQIFVATVLLHFGWRQKSNLYLELNIICEIGSRLLYLHLCMSRCNKLDSRVIMIIISNIFWYFSMVVHYFCVVSNLFVLWNLNMYI